MLHNVTVLVLVYCNESYIVITHTHYTTLQAGL